MAKKIRVKVVWYVFWIAALVTCSLYLKAVGKNPARQAVKIYHLRSIGLWLRCAPKEEKERFAVHLAQMSENDFGYSELKSIVEQFKKQ